MSGCASPIFSAQKVILTPLAAWTEKHFCPLSSSPCMTVSWGESRRSLANVQWVLFWNLEFQRGLFTRSKCNPGNLKSVSFCTNDLRLWNFENWRQNEHVEINSVQIFQLSFWIVWKFLENPLARWQFHGKSILRRIKLGPVEINS